MLLMSPSVSLLFHSLHTAVCILCWCMHSWPVRQTIVSQQPLKNSSLSFMPNCISGISTHSRDSLVCCCTQYKSNWVLVLCYCWLILHSSMLTRDTYKINGQLWSFLAEALCSYFLPLPWSIGWKLYQYIYKRRAVTVHCSLNTIQHSAVYDWT